MNERATAIHHDPWAMEAWLVGNDGTNLVFLLSTPRSGSTLVSAILSMHPQILCPNEPWFLLGLASLFEGGNITYAKYEHSGVERALADLISESEFADAARAFALSVYNRKLANENRMIFIDKTPRYYHILEFIDLLFPFSKKIWIKRNPLDVAASFKDSWNVPVENLVDPNFGPMALDLPLGLRRLTSFFTGQPRTCELAYEDLVQAPAETVARLCAFLDIDYIDGMERYGRDQTALGRRKTRIMGDAKIFDHVEPHTNSVGRWERSLGAEQVQDLLCCIGERTLRRMGYGELVERLTAMGFWFPSESTVDDTLSAFVNAAKWLPWAPNNAPAS